MKKVRKPRPMNLGIGEISVYESGIYVERHVTHTRVQLAKSLFGRKIDPKKLNAWLGRAIAYLEQKETK